MARRPVSVLLAVLALGFLGRSAAARKKPLCIDPAKPVEDRLEDLSDLVAAR